MSAKKTWIHETAIVGEGASVGGGTKIWHWVHIVAGAEIGSDCVLGQNVYVAKTAIIGDGCHIQNNVSIYDGVILEDGVFCGPSVVFTNVKTPRAHISRNTLADFEQTLVRRGVTLGANATIICGVELGEYAFVGAGAVVSRDVKPHALVAGVPARQIGWACQCGFRLTGDGPGYVCEECGEGWLKDEGVLRKVPEQR